MKNILFLLFVGSIVFAQFDWQGDGVKVRQGIHIEWQRTAVVGNNGEVIFVWSDTRHGGRDIYAQKVDINGNFLWGDGGTPVVFVSGRQEDPIAVPDENGGVYIAWRDYRNEPEYGDVYAQHLFSDGSLDWDNEGVSLSTQSGIQESINMCADGLGGAFVIWNDKSVNIYGHIYATHLSPDGGIIAPNIGVPIITSSGGHNKVSIELGGEGFATMVWEDSRILEETDIYAQRIDVNCNTLWSTPEEGGTPISDSLGVEQISPKVTHVSGDTTVIVWEDYRNSPTSGDIYIQYIDGDGNILLEEDGSPLCVDASKQNSPRVKANSNYAFIVWEDFRNHPNWSDIYGQCYSLDGGILWSVGGKPISTAIRKQTEPRLTADDSNGAYFVWMDERNGDHPETEIYLQHITAEGDTSFPANGLAICEAPYYQFNPLVRRDKNEGAFIIWGDQRTGSIGLYAQHVHPSVGITFTENGLDIYDGLDGDAIFSNSLYLEDNRTLIYWEDKREGGEHPQTYGQIINSDYGNLDEYNGVRLSKNDSQKNPQAVKAGNHIFLNFQGVDDTWGAITQYYQILDLNLNIIGDSTGTTVFENPHGWNQDYSQLTSGLDGYVYLAFSDTRLGDHDVYVQKYDELGIPQWIDGGVILTDMTNDDIVQSIEPIPGGGCIVLWYGGDWTDLNIYAQALTGEGTIPVGWSDDPLNVCTESGHQYNVKTSITENGVFCIWEDSRNGNSDIFAQLIGYDGNLAGDENGFTITDQTNDQLNPALGYNSNENEMLVCWEDFVSGSDYDLLCRSIDIDSLSITPEIVIADGPGDQTSPNIFLNQNDSYMITWEDSRSGGSTDIYYQEMDTSGFIYEDGGIVVCEVEFPQQYPEINIYSETDSSYVIFWEDMRSSGKEELRNIYAQSITLTSVGIERDHQSTPDDFRILNIYPNPFNPITTIAYKLSMGAKVRLSIFDLLGREIAVLTNGFKPSGFYKTFWDASHKASGIYFCQLKVDDKVVTIHKMILIK